MLCFCWGSGIVFTVGSAEVTIGAVRACCSTVIAAGMDVHGAPTTGEVTHEDELVVGAELTGG